MKRQTPCHHRTPCLQLQPPEINQIRLRAYRLSRIREQLRRNDIPLCVITNPANLRYAIDFREYVSFQSRIPGCYLFVPLEGPVVMHGAFSKTLETVDEYRPSNYVTTFDGGLDLTARAAKFAAEVRDFLHDLGVRDDKPRVALERITPSTAHALGAEGLMLQDGEGLLEAAKVRKSPDEIICMRHSIAVAQYAMGQMQAALVPGISENELWSIIHRINIAHDGDWIDGRMLCSGPRTNPWYQEASRRIIQAGDLVAFDTDMIGPFGYCADISRTWLCGDGPASDEQRSVYTRAYEEVQHNIELMQVGIGFKEFADRAYTQDDEFIAHRYACVAHGGWHDRRIPENLLFSGLGPPRL